MQFSLLFYLSLILQIIIYGIGTYYFVISLFAWHTKRDEPRHISDKTNTFAIVVAAHNEERVIEDMVDSLKRLDYPDDAYDIYIVADNCSDNTAELARNKGAIVYERSDIKARGKGFALEWIFSKIFMLKKQYDYIVVFDADNLVSKDFLKEMNKSHNKGYPVLQGYIDSKNPNDSWITAAYSISFWSINRLFQNSRFNLNLSCQLSGTGFSVDTNILRQIGWGATCLTEDMEFTMKLVLNNIKVAFCMKALVYDEKPITLKQSWKQRIRWMQGHADVASRFSLPLIKKAIKEKSFVPIDCLLYLAQPVRIITTGLVMILAYIPSRNIFTLNMLIEKFSLSYVWKAFLLAQFLYTPLILFVERRLNFRIILGYITYSVYSLTWIPISIIGILKMKNTEWAHTEHTRRVSIKEFENT